MQESCRQEHLLAHAFRIGRHGHVPVVVQGEQPQQAIDAVGRGSRGQVSQLTDHDEVFQAGKVRV